MKIFVKRIYRDMVNFQTLFSETKTLIIGNVNKDKNEWRIENFNCFSFPMFEKDGIIYHHVNLEGGIVAKFSYNNSNGEVEHLSYYDTSIDPHNPIAVYKK